MYNACLKTLYLIMVLTKQHINICIYRYISYISVKLTSAPTWNKVTCRYTYKPSFTVTPKCGRYNKSEILWMVAKSCTSW